MMMLNDARRTRDLIQICLSKANKYFNSISGDHLILSKEPKNQLTLS